LHLEPKSQTEFFWQLRRFVKFYKIFCIIKAKARTTIEMNFREKLKVAQSTLHPHNPTLYEQIESLSKLLATLEKHTVVGQ